MFKKNLGKLGLSAMALGVMIPSTAAFAEESTPVSAANNEQNNVTSETQNQELSVEVYDKNDNLVKVYTKKNLKRLILNSLLTLQRRLNILIM